MEQFMAVLDYLKEFNAVSIILRLLLPVIAGGIIGAERGRHGRAAGLRTHILVCLGGAMTSLCSLYVSTVSGLGGDIFRIPAQVISGIGFLGAGIILIKNNSTVAGLTTAAGMWVTATIGVAFGYGFYEGALLASVICIINAALLTKIEHEHKQATLLYVEVSNIEKVRDILKQIEVVLEKDMVLESIPAKSGITGNVGFNITTFHKHDYEQIQDTISRIDGVSFVVQG